MFQDKNVSIVYPNNITIHEVDVSNGTNISLPEKSSFSVKTNDREKSLTIELGLGIIADKTQPIDTSAQPFNQIILSDGHQGLGKTRLSLFFSQNKASWSKIPILNIFTNGNHTIYSLPLIRAIWVQLILHNADQTLPEKISGSIKIQSNIKIESSGSKNRLWVPENLIDGREDYGWEILPNTQKDEWVLLDLGRRYFINAIALRSVKEALNNFPDNFIIKLSLDKKNWEGIVQESDFLVSSFKWYYWQFFPMNARYIQINISKPQRQENKNIKILDVDIMAKPENEVLDVSSQQTRAFFHASELIAGHVKLAEHNATKPLHVVQSDDPRLRKASTDQPGIVQLARNGQNVSGFALQANDPRVREATTEYPGIVELAHDKENTTGTVVQGSDSRLKYATNKEAGILRLANNGESIPNAAVQGNDKRLRLASTRSPGIVKLAQDGASIENAALQSNDSRLREASIQWHGLMRFAVHNEVSEKKAVQSNDPRLAEATEAKKGRIQFAKDGETRPLKAVQASDSRLSKASDKKAGIVRLAKPGQKEPDSVVRADDPRLEDVRKALPHFHSEYAPKDHTLNSHKGALNISSDTNTPELISYNISDIDSYPLSSKNKEGLSAAFSGGIVVGSDKNKAIDSYSKSNVTIRSKSKEKSAGIFFSEKAYALHLPSHLDGLSSSGLAILAEGDSLLKGRLFLEQAASITIQYTSFTDDIFAEGDILAVQKNGKIRKMRSNHEAFVGVFTHHPDFCLSRSENSKSIYINIAGLTKMRVKGKIEAGSWIGYLDDEPGVGRELHRMQKQHGFAIAMESSSKEIEKLVLCLIKK